MADDEYLLNRNAWYHNELYQLVELGRALRKERDEAVAARDSWAKQCNLASEYQATTASELSAVWRQLGEAIALAEERLGHAHQLQADIDAETEWRTAFRREHGAQGNETMMGFLVRLANERNNLRKLFDDAGQGEHNVLALIDHYQNETFAAEARVSDLEAALRYANSNTSMRESYHELEWTRERPTLGGDYWCRRRPGEGEMVRVYAFNGSFDVNWIGSRGPVNIGDLGDVEWLGPLEAPP